eukprot:UC1_evm1s198
MFSRTLILFALVATAFSLDNEFILRFEGSCDDQGLCDGSASSQKITSTILNDDAVDFSVSEAGGMLGVKSHMASKVAFDPSNSGAFKE